MGVVTDPSGNTVLGAEVTVTNEETAIAVIRMTTDSSGNYVATALSPGRYSVSVKSAGFKVFVSAGIIVNVQDRIAVNVPMEVGQLSETVEVVGAAQALQTDSSYLGQVVDSQRIVDLPLNGRFFTQLALLTSGTLPTVPSARDAATGGFSSNGIRPYQNSFLLDGIDNNSLSEDLTNQASYVYGPSPDAIAEFKVQTNSMSAEFGRSGGAVMNVNIKSGTNGYHGSAFEFLRNQALDARNFFAGNVNPEYRQNQFGGAVGGPVRKNRIFFFADYQGTAQRIGDTFVATVAPVAWHTGNFSGFHPILDPTTKQPIPNNQVPASAIDPVAAKLTSMMVDPNATGSTSAIGVANNYVSNPVQPARTDQGDIRIDYQARPQDALFGRFSMSDQNLSVPVSIPAPLGGPQAWTNNSRSAVLGETHIFSAHVISEARIGYTRSGASACNMTPPATSPSRLVFPGSRSSLRMAVCLTLR